MLESANLVPRAGENKMPLTLEQTEALVQTILHGPTIQQPSALFELIKAVSDPRGDRHKYDCAINALRAIDPQTREYDQEWFRKRAASPVRVDFVESLVNA